MALTEEIELARREIKTDAYSMSFGELISLYQKGELDLHPEFQRVFRWTQRQKTNLVESILLGIPLPPIFVSQRRDGIWDVIDGLQRISTVLELVGELRDASGNSLPPLTLLRTDYLPSLEGKVFENENNPDGAFSSAQRLLIKRAKVDVKIILEETGETAKFELFRRLNTGGSSLSHQEIRNCILMMVNRDAAQWTFELAENRDFLDSISISDRLLDEQYHQEMAVRFVVFRLLPEAQLARTGPDLSEFLTDQMVSFALNRSIDYQAEKLAFSKTFRLINESLGEDAFRRFDRVKGKFQGAFLVSLFEVIALGIGFNIDTWTTMEANEASQKIEMIAKEILWQNPEFTEYSGSGTTASRRIPKTVSLGRRVFAL